MADVEQLISKYIELRDYVKIINKKHKEELEPYVTGMLVIEEALGDLLKELNLSSLKCSAGTAFKKPSLSVSVVDKDSFLSWVIQGNKVDFLTSHICKEAVKEHLEENEKDPIPGLQIIKGEEIQVRRS